MGQKQWKISAKLFLIVGVFVVGFAIFWALASYTLDYVKVNGPVYNTIATGKDLVADILPPPEYILEAYLVVLEMETATQQDQIQRLASKLEELHKDYDDRHSYWKGVLPEGEMKTAMIEESYTPAVDFFNIATTQFVPDVLAGNLPMAHSLAHGILQQRYEQQRAAIDKVVDIADKSNMEEEKLARDTTEHRTNQLRWLGLGIVVIAVLLSYWVGQAISRPLRQVVQVISIFSTEVASTVSEQERMAAQQAAAVHETTATMEELGASSRQSAEQSEAASAGARQALALADDGSKTVAQTLEGMTDMSTRSAAIADQILRLSEQIGQIGNITNAVSDLANQTNLLALNAAVEAARAGEHGRGFAVVAGEIRKLADQSKKSAERINALIADIQRATNSTVMVAEEGSKTVAHGTQLARQTGEAFQELALSSGGTFESMQQIALNAKQQAIAVGQVVEAMTSLNAGARDSAAAVSQTKAGIHDLNDAAVKLAALV